MTKWGPSKSSDTAADATRHGDRRRPIRKMRLSRGSVTLYAALSATTNQLTWFYGNTKDSEGIVDLIEILYNQHHGMSRIFVTWDAASWHGSASLENWVGNLNAFTRSAGCGPIIEFVPLPSSSQFLNVIEAIFSAMKRAVIHFSDYQLTEETKSAISTHFRERNDYFRENPKMRQETRFGKLTSFRTTTIFWQGTIANGDWKHA